MTAPFYIHKRPTKDPKRHIYYVQFVDAKGNRLTAISTGQTTRAKAEKWAKERMDKGSAVQPTLREFAGKFFDWETSPWIKRQLAKGRRFSEPVARWRQSQLEHRILPQFGDFQLAEINAKGVEDWLAGLELSGSSRNHLLVCFRLVLREAKFAGYIKHNPLADAERFGENPKVRDIFTLAELHALFPEDDEALVKVWQDTERAIAFMLLASTGIRSGELRALRWLNVLRGRALYIDSSLDQMLRPKSTKTGGVRVVLLPARAQALLGEWRQITKWTTPEDFILSVRQGEPHARTWLARTLPGAMERAGIESRRRNLVPHSFRHTFVTLVRGLAPDAIAQAMSGHASREMLDHYSHFGPDALLAQLEPAGRDVIEALWQDNSRKLTPGNRQ